MFCFFQTCGKQQRTKPQLADSKTKDEEEKRRRGLRLVDEDSLKQVWETTGENEEQKDSGGFRSCSVNQHQFISLFRGNFPHKNKTGSKNSTIY